MWIHARENRPTRGFYQTTFSNPRRNSTVKHPMQKLLMDDDGTIRFQENKIVSYLLRNGTSNMNEIASMNFPNKDLEQFVQLIGYAVRGFGELEYVKDKTYAKAEKKAKRLQAAQDASQQHSQ